MLKPRTLEDESYEPVVLRFQKATRVPSHRFRLLLYGADMVIGVVAVPTDRVLHSKTDRNTELQNGEQDEVLEEPVKVLDAQSTFDEFVVWGHEIMPAADDPFVKGVEEWMKFAEAVSLPALVILLRPQELMSNSFSADAS